MAYSAKYASALLRPVPRCRGHARRPGQGRQNVYQMDPANTDEALREVALDIAEGADMVMVKPGMPYLDVRAPRQGRVPACPPSPTRSAASTPCSRPLPPNGWLDHDAVMMESLLAFKRAGADGILTYFAIDAAKRLRGQ